MAETASGIGALAIVVFSGGYDRVHYALVLASAAAATDRPTILFFTHRALPALLADDGWQQLDPADDGSTAAERDRLLRQRKVADMAELLESAGALGVRFIACEMGWRTLGIDKPNLRADLNVETAGVVTLLSEIPASAQLLFV
jgi:peroxiredoxin family protein